MDSTSDTHTPKIEATLTRIQHWRETRQKRSPMPDALWAETAELSAEHGVHRVSTQLGLGYESLKKRVITPEVALAPAGQSCGGFIEIAGSSVFSGVLLAQLVLELQRPDGARLTLRSATSQAADIPALVTAFFLVAR